MISSLMQTDERLLSPTVIEPIKPDTRSRNMRICAWCGNRGRKVCVSCQEEGRYRHLEPAPLEAWEQPPELPTMRDLVDLPAQDKLALIWLDASYRQRREPPGDI